MMEQKLSVDIRCEHGSDLSAFCKSFEILSKTAVEGVVLNLYGSPSNQDTTLSSSYLEPTQAGGGHVGKY